jgi:alcohol dehydrogenase
MSVSVPSTMKALVLGAHGDLDQLQVVTGKTVPRAAPDGVVIRVRASSFNYHDVFTVKGMHVGNRVLVNPLNREKGLMGEMLDGGMAEYCAVSAAQLIALPDAVGFNAASALPVAYGTAHRMLVTHATVKAGDRVLILGASGGVGTASLLLAKQLGAEVIACAGSDEKAEQLKALGADHVVNYRTTNFSKWAIERYGKPQRRNYEGGVDMVVNFTGGDTWVPSLKCLKRGGALLVCGATAGHDPQEDLRYIWSFELRVIGSNSFYDDNLRALLGQIERGELTPAIDRAVPLEQAAEGLRLIRDREVLGKVVVNP